jgi:hypothetical protein
MIRDEVILGEGDQQIGFNILVGTEVFEIIINIKVVRDSVTMFELYNPYVSPTTAAPKLKMLPSEYRKLKEEINYLSLVARNHSVKVAAV